MINQTPKVANQIFTSLGHLLIVIIIMELMLMSGCSSAGSFSSQVENSDSVTKAEEKTYDLEVIEEVGSIHFNKEDLINDGTYNAAEDENVIPNREKAEQYAKLVMGSRIRGQLHKKQLTQYDEENGIWVVRFMPGDDTVGGDVSIAFSERTGEVLMIWGGE